MLSLEIFISDVLPAKYFHKSWYFLPHGHLALLLHGLDPRIRLINQLPKRLSYFLLIFPLQGLFLNIIGRWQKAHSFTLPIVLINLIDLPHLLLLSSQNPMKITTNILPNSTDLQLLILVFRL